MNSRKTIPIALLGNVDHGKSTLLGRLLLETENISREKTERVEAYCRSHGKKMEFAFFVDALADEQEQGITIDRSRVYLRGARQDFVFHDNPGHREFFRNLVSGTADAKIGVILLDVSEELSPSFHSHAALLHFLEIPQAIIAFNKMDLVNYSQEIFEAKVKEVSRALEKLGLQATFLPLSAYSGEGLTRFSAALSWFTGNPLLQTLETLTAEEETSPTLFRLPLQGVYHFNAKASTKRSYVGTILSGSLKEGEDLLFSPSGHTAKIKKLVSPQGKSSFEMGDPIAFTLSDDIFVKRGELVSRVSENRPRVSKTLETKLLWWGKAPLDLNKTYSLKLGSQVVAAKIVGIDEIWDPHQMLQIERGEVLKGEVCRCKIQLKIPCAFDTKENNPLSSRFVLVDDFQISGGGFVLE